MMRHHTLGVVRLQITALVTIFLVAGIDPERALQLAAEELPVGSDAGSSVTHRSALMAARPIAVADPPAPGEQSVVVKSPPDDRIAVRPIVLPFEPERIALNQVTDVSQQRSVGEIRTLQRTKSLRDISLDIAPPRLVNDQQMPMAPPQDYATEALPVLAAEQPFTRGDLAAAGYDWQPSPDGLTFCYQPLYFEEVNLERYGRSFGLAQPIVSAVAFYGRIPAMPYMAFARPARRCTHHAHWTLPGYKIPEWEPQPIVPSVTGTAVEAAAIYGVILLIP